MRAAFFSTVLSLWMAGAPAQEPRGLEVISAEFGLFNALETGRPPFISTPFVPLLEGQAYGWVIVVKTSDRTVRWREEFTRPGSGNPAGTYRMRVSINGELVRTFEFRVE